MHCKYCGNALPSNGGHCPNCGRMIPVDQMIRLRQMTDPKFNEYKNQNTSFYKQNNQSKQTNKPLLVIIIIILLILLLVLLKGMIG